MNKVCMESNERLERVKQRFERMKGLSMYFERQAETQSLFYPEYKASKEINEILELKEKLTEQELERIVEILEELDKTEHYNGSGWLDYKLHLSASVPFVGIKNELVARLMVKLK
jgi:hypothetical protein